MNRIALSFACCAVFSLASCGTPEQRCESRVSSETRNVSRLLDEVQANLDRGYAWENQPRRRSSFSMCAGGYGGGYYRGGLAYGGCYGGMDVTRQRVAIDPEAETRKRDSLQKRLTQLATGGAAACIAHYSAKT